MLLRAMEKTSPLRAPRHPQPQLEDVPALAGMAARVQVYAGTFEAGPAADGGFVVRAMFPVGAR